MLEVEPSDQRDRKATRSYQSVIEAENNTSITNISKTKRDRATMTV